MMQMFVKDTWNSVNRSMQISQWRIPEINLIRVIIAKSESLVTIHKTSDSQDSSQVLLDVYLITFVFPCYK